MKWIVPIVVTGFGTAFLGQPALAAEQSAGSGATQQAADAWHTIRAFSVDKKDEAVSYGKKLLRDGDAQIGRLEAGAGKMSGEAKVAWDKQMRNLKQARAVTAVKLEGMEKATGSAWNDAKQGFADAYRDFRKTYDKATGRSK